MRIGIFGGTFDPVHLGHTSLAKKAVYELSLDILYVIPNGKAPHKENQAAKEQRFSMVEIAFSDMEKVIVSDYELKKETPSYTWETLQYFQGQHPDGELFFIMGMDNLTEIFSWKHPERICKAATLCVFGRTNYVKNADAVDRLEQEYGAKLHWIPFDFEVSSTELKERILQGEYVFDKLSLWVFQYSIRYGLYGMVAVNEFDCYEKELHHYIEEKRFRHSIGVACTAYLLAIRYGENPKDAYFAGLLHDIAKRMPLTRQMKLCEKIELHPDEIAYPKMLHAPAGAGFVQKQYDIRDEKILRAIRFHTMGDKDMTLFDKIIYMADYIEPCRDFDGLEELRSLTFSDIDRAIIRGIDMTILSLVEEHRKISPVLLTVRNDLLEREQKGN